MGYAARSASLLHAVTCATRVVPQTAADRQKKVERKKLLRVLRLAHPLDAAHAASLATPTSSAGIPWAPAPMYSRASQKPA